MSVCDDQLRQWHERRPHPAGAGQKRPLALSCQIVDNTATGLPKSWRPEVSVSIYSIHSSRGQSTTA